MQFLRAMYLKPVFNVEIFLNLIEQLSMNKKVFIGVDGCSAGWFAVILAAGDEKNCEWEVELFAEFSLLVNFLEKKYEKTDFLILIDIPIGLKDGGNGERISDLEARKILRTRKSSIFPVPCREAVYAESYEKACKLNSELAGKSISKQAWNIVPKIRDVDTFLIENEIYRGKVKEVAPEICFQAFTGFPMGHSKKSSDGFLERIKALRDFCMSTDEIVDAALSKYRRKEVSKDDILDALAAAITAKLGSKDGFEYVPGKPETDIKGLKIQTVYCIPGSGKVKF
jgi:predicted RNase H-like nuclease